MDLALVDKLLGETHLSFDETPAVAELRSDAAVESPTRIRKSFGDDGPYRPFAQRGLLIAFDGEGDYHVAGAHAKLVRYVLTRSGLRNPPVEELRSPAGFELVACGIRAKSDSTSDYVDVTVVVQVANGALAKTRAPFRLLQLQSEDQGVILALAPLTVSDELREALGDFVADR